MKIVDYLTEDDTRIGKTILSQIKALDKWALDSWGAKNIILRSNGVRFDVRGSKFRGQVLVTLDKGSDLYDIDAGIIRNMEWVSKKNVNGISVENLVKTLDEIIG